MNMKKELTPLKAIRAKCLDCRGGSMRDVRLCTCQDCTLHPFRMGKNPRRAGVGIISNLSEKSPTQ